MCCFITALLLAGPRLAMLVWWIFNPIYVNAAFDHWIWGILGWIFLPWTTLMYTIVWSAGGVHGANWLAVALGVFLDLLSYSGRMGQKMYQQRSAGH